MRILFPYLCLLGLAACCVAPLRADDHHEPLHNLIKVAPSYYSGAEPVGEEAFQKLAEMGVKYIVSVDGIRPNVELANKHGIRYIHIPVQYSGIDREQELKLIRAAKEIDQPVYVHCHHGKHRGPAGMAIMCLAAGIFDKDDANKYLHGAGTSPEYKGLWRDINAFQMPDDQTELPALEEIAEIESIAAYMAEAERRFDDLHARLAEEKTLTEDEINQLNGEMLLLWELIRESRRTVALDKDADEKLIMAFEKSDALLRKTRDDLKKVDSRETWLGKLAEIKKDCKSCHATFRN